MKYRSLSRHGRSPALPDRITGRLTPRLAAALVLSAAGVAVALSLFAARAPDDEQLVPQQTSAAAVPAPASPAPPPRGCLPTGDGFFRARLDGELQMRIDWSNAQIECEGMARPGGDGIRLSFRSARPQSEGLLILLGIAGLSESSTGRALPANVTIIEETSSRIFGTLGDDKCTVDELRQELVSAWQPKARVYRVSGRGFCTEPALAVGGERSVLMSTFDFAGQVTYDSGDGATHKEERV